MRESAFPSQHHTQQRQRKDRPESSQQLPPFSHGYGGKRYRCGRQRSAIIREPGGWYYSGQNGVRHFSGYATLSALPPQPKSSKAVYAGNSYGRTGNQSPPCSELQWRHLRPSVAVLIWCYRQHHLPAGYCPAPSLITVFLLGSIANAHTGNAIPVVFRAFHGHLREASRNVAVHFVWWILLFHGPSSDPCF